MIRRLVLGLFAIPGRHLAGAADYPRNEVFGAIGVGAAWPDEGSLGSGRSSTAFTALKTAVLAPMPRVSASTATAVTLWFFSSSRQP